MADPTTVVATVTGGIEAANQALTLYNKVIDQVIPWKAFEDTIKVLIEHEKQYSAKAGVIVGEVRTLLMDSRDNYLAATQSVYEWCGVSSQLLTAYLKLFEDYSEAKAQTQKMLLTKVLGDGITKMGAAQDQLAKSSMSFNGSAGKLLTLKTQLNADFSEGSAYFDASVAKLRTEAYAGAAVGLVGGPIGLAIAYSIAAGVVEGKMIPALKQAFAETQATFERLHATIKKADTDIDKTKTELQTEIRKIGDLKTQTEATRLYIEDPNLITMVQVAGTELIRQCSEYRQRHAGASIV